MRRKNAGSLPVAPLLVLTDRRLASRLGVVATVTAAVDGGARAVVLREKDLPRERRQELALALQEVLAPEGGVLLVAGADVELARAVGAAGVHLASADPFPERADDQGPGDHTEFVVGRSCHDHDEVRAAADEGADYATVSPVLASTSKPGYGPAFGIDGLAALAGVTDLPLVALGGLSESSAAECLVAGAAGIAVMGAVMASADPAATVAGLRSALSGSPLWRIEAAQPPRSSTHAGTVGLRRR